MGAVVDRRRVGSVFVYVTLIAVVIGPDKPGMEQGINGTWFLLTVSTQSIAVVAGLLLPRRPGDLLAFVGLAAFTLGVVLYLIVMTMVFLRWTFLQLDPSEAEPPAWIAAGAVAITVLAGSNLLLARQASPRIDRLGTVHRGRGRAGVGDGDVLVPAHDRHRRLASHRSPVPAALPPGLLGDGLPARHVRRRHVPDANRHRPRCTRLAPEADTRRSRPPRGR